MAGNKVIEFTIRCRNKATEAINTLMRNLANLKAGFEMLKSAASNAMAFLRKAFAFETMTVQFKTLIGNLDEAREHMKMLQELGNTPPFSLEEFAAASRAMMVMTEGALGYKKSLELVGDAAAATGVPIQSLAHEVGRAYAIIRDGQPLTRATMALRNMGVITPEVAAQLDELQKAGASNAEIWAKMEEALKRYKGAMEETEKTGDGLVGAIGSEWDNALRTFGEALLETSKDGLGKLLEKMRELREDGSIAVWAEKVGGWLSSVIDGAKKTAEAISWLYENSGLKKVVNGVSNFVGGAVESTANFFGTLAGGGSFADARQAQKDTWANRKKERELDPEMERIDAEERAKKIADDKAKKEADAARKKAEEEERIAKQLAEKQAKLDAERAKAAAEAKAKAEAEAAKKAAEAERKERERIEREIAKERERLWKENVRAMQKAYSDAQKNDSDAQRRLADAQTNESRAWGWYRDRGSWTAQLAEERAEAEAQKQFDRDFEKLKGKHRDWRTTDRLSDDEELIRRVGLAREEKKAAEEYAKQTAEATQKAADALEAIQNAITEGGAE